MDYKVLYRKYRPTNFNSIVGQEYTIKMLKNAIINNKISHAYLFTGPRGTGKTTTAKVFAKTINCENLIDGEACGTCNSCKNFNSNADIIEIDAASNNGVDDVRELINNVKIAPSGGRYKIYIIDEVHMMTQSAFNALLLTLEEPPSHAVFIMATTNVESVPITILSRCQRFNFKKISLDVIIEQLKYVCGQEKIEIEDDALTEIAYLSEGGMRDALSLLDQLSSKDEKITLDKILENYGSISSVFIKKVIDKLEEQKTTEIVDCLQTLENEAADYKIFIKKLIKELTNKAILVKENKEKSIFSYSQIKNLIFDLNDCMNKVSIHVSPYLLIQMVLLAYVKSDEEIKKVDNNNTNIQASKSDKKVNQDVSLKEKEQVQSKVEVKKKVVQEPIKAREEPIYDESNSIDYDNEMEEYLEELKQVRINNCFATAKKTMLNEIQECLKQLEENNNNSFLNMILDCNVVAAGDVVILASEIFGTVELINHHLEEIEKAFKDSFNREVFFIALSMDEWLEWKKEYIKNIKNGVKYEYIDESGLQTMKPTPSSQLEDFAVELFGSDKVQII